jgi:intracellular multiplication protein IcmW
MPDLSIPATHRFWSDYSDPMIYRVIMFMESVENWTLDGDENLERQLQELGPELDNIAQLDMGELGHEETFVRIAGNVKTGRALRLLQAIDSMHPGSASRVLVYAEEHTVDNTDPAGVFLRRNIVFERLRLLSRIFGTDRMARVLRVLEGEEA